MTKAEEYNTKTIKVGNATISIHRPVLTEAERVRRTEEIVLALGRYGRAIIGEEKCKASF